MSKLDQTANDDTPEALKAAAHNFSLLVDDWCRCRQVERENAIAYYRSPEHGAHGWMCTRCYRIVQTG